MLEFRRNSARFDRAYRPSKAQERTNERRASENHRKSSLRAWNIAPLEAMLAATKGGSS